MSTRFSTLAGRAVTCAISVAALCLVYATTAWAQAEPHNRRTTVTFSAPFEIPGASGVMTLPAGTYVFKLMDAVNERSVVQVFNKDESKLLSTILAIPNYRLKPTDQLVMTFAERAAGRPQALRAWFAPGDKWGQEFVYPKAEAMEFAVQTREPVLYYTPKPEPTPPVEPTVATVRTEPIQAVTPVGKDIPVAQVVEPPPVQVVPPAPVLPKTAGELPLLALLGVLLLAVGLSARVLRCVH